MANILPAFSSFALAIAKLPDWTTAEDGNCLAGLDFSQLGYHEPGRQDVREKDRLIIVNIARKLDGSHVRIWNPRKLCLQSVKRTAAFRAAEKRRACVWTIRIRLVTLRVITIATIRAISAGDS